MLEIKIKNQKNEEISLTQNPNYSLMSVEGMDPAAAMIGTAASATMDGSVFRSAKIGERNIVILIAVEEPCEKNRVDLYRYVRTKKELTVYVKNEERDVYINGYAEAMPIGFFEQKETVQISIICTDPYFRDVEKTSVSISGTESLFEFPFSIPEEGIEFSSISENTEKDIINRGDAEVGAIFRLYASAPTKNPSIYLPFLNIAFFLEISMIAGDEIVINTIKGQKIVKLIRNGIETNIINTLKFGSKWLQLEPGQNRIGYLAEPADSLTCMIEFNALYEGV